MPKAIIAAVCLVLAASAITASVLLVAGQEQQDSQEQLNWPERAERTATAPAAQPSPPPAATREPSPEPTAPPTTPQQPPGVPTCLPCEARGRQQLRVTAEDIQLGPDGKYYVPDRGDGCAYQQIALSPMRAEGWISLYDPGCASMWLYLPATGEVQGLPACPCYEVKARDQLPVTAEDIQLGKDGKYYVPDRGDGCAYEQDTSTSWGLVLRAPGCEMFWVQVSEPGEVHGVIP